MAKPQRSKILWRCRRGMREMDLLFTEYISEHFEHLSNEQYQSLEALLNESDSDIMSWIMGRAEPTCPEYTQIVNAMRVLKDKTIKSN